jgi:hypothetical protein
MHREGEGRGLEGKERNTGVVKISQNFSLGPTLGIARREAQDEGRLNCRFVIHPSTNSSVSGPWLSNGSDAAKKWRAPLLAVLLISSVKHHLRSILSAPVRINLPFVLLPQTSHDRPGASLTVFYGPRDFKTNSDASL